MTRIREPSSNVASETSGSASAAGPDWTFTTMQPMEAAGTLSRGNPKTPTNLNRESEPAMPPLDLTALGAHIARRMGHLLYGKRHQIHERHRRRLQIQHRAGLNLHIHF